MALSDAIEDEVGRVITITWHKQGDAETPEDLTGATLIGIIETTPPTAFTVRAVAGALVLVTPESGIFTWTYTAADTATAGKFTVQFLATIGAVVKKSIPEPWVVQRSPATPS